MKKPFFLKLSKTEQDRLSGRDEEKIKKLCDFTKKEIRFIQNTSRGFDSTTERSRDFVTEMLCGISPNREKSDAKGKHTVRTLILENPPRTNT